MFADERIAGMSGCMYIDASDSLVMSNFVSIVTLTDTQFDSLVANGNCIDAYEFMLKLFCDDFLEFIHRNLFVF